MKDEQRLTKGERHWPFILRPSSTGRGGEGRKGWPLGLRARGSLRGEHGQNLVLVALSMLALLSVLALVLDGGYAFLMRRKMQNAADAGAIAGARKLALTSNQVYAYDEARTYTEGYNLADNANVTIAGNTVTVEAVITFRTFFAGLLGYPQLTARATALARFGRVLGAGDLLPIAVRWNDFQYNQIYQLWGDSTGPGGWGWLDWNSVPVGNPELVNNILTPSNSGQWSVDDLVPSGPGVQNSSGVRNALNWWLSKPEQQRHWTLIIYDYTQGSGANMQYHIVAFADFILTSYNFQGSDKYIKGKFQRWVNPSVDIDPSSGCDPYGLCGVRLEG
jgi:hypothetical protein